MKRILVATDFSTRSDRALRRATLLARAATAGIILLHVVDDDQPARLLEAEQRESRVLLHDLAGMVRSMDGLPCDLHLGLGEPFQVIGAVADELQADVIVMGPHRRKALRDVFVGTTVERTIRESRRPVIMANAVPARPYARILAATDLSVCSAHALQTARDLGFFERSETTFVLHAFDAPAQSLMLRSSVTTQQLKDYVAQEEERASTELKDFLHKVELGPARRVLEPIEGSAAKVIRDCARENRIDLVLLGTLGRSGAGRLFLGSVAEEVLRYSEVDVLVVPPAFSRPVG